MSKSIFGITGAINSGKSWLGYRLLNYYKNISLIEIDDIRRYILWFSTEKEHILLRQELAALFNIKTATSFHWLNRKIFTDYLFLNEINLSNYSTIVTPHIHKFTTDIINNSKQSIFFIIWVYLLEENYDKLINKDIIMIENEKVKYNDFLNHRYDIQKKALNTLKKADIIFNHEYDIQSFFKILFNKNKVSYDSI